MDLLIIGNGFDLAHGLPTKYTDFLKYCCSLKLGMLSHKIEGLGMEFDDFLNNNIWLNYFLEITTDLNSEQTWIDFEKEVGEIVNSIDTKNFIVDCKQEIGNCNDNINIITITTSTFFAPKLTIFMSMIGHKEGVGKWKLKIEGIKDLKSFVDAIYLEFRKFAKSFEIYCIKIDKKPTNKFTRMLNFDYVLSFNYTNTYERLYGCAKTKYCYVHGKAQEDVNQTNIVFGINDNLPYEEQSKNFQFIRFKKYYQRIIFKTGSEYKDWIFSVPRSLNSLCVHIAGHSLDITDHDILYEIFSIEKYRIIIYYHSPADYEDKVQKTIQLLAYGGLNGRDELIRRVHGEQWSIKFVDQYDENKGLFAITEK